MLRFIAVLCVAASCSGSGELCEAWATATCPSDYPNLQPGVSFDACESNFGFSCGSDNCDAEYEAKIECETRNPNCCNATECNNASLTACSAVSTTWSDCTSRVRDACDG